MCDRMRDTRQGQIKEEIEGACVCCRQTSLERFIDRCVSKKKLCRLWENDLKKKMNVRDG